MVCAAATAAASRAAQQEEDLQASTSGAVELDEFGRDANMMKRQEAAQRRQRRMQRLQQQAATQTGSQVGDLALMRHDKLQMAQGLVFPAQCRQADRQRGGRAEDVRPCLHHSA